jgi:hypothetical protein
MNEVIVKVTTETPQIPAVIKINDKVFPIKR